jgi:uncharacterized protein (TIGR00255 family)
MIKSMTGFSSVTRECEIATVGVTVRTLNHRFLDLQLRLPGSLGELEGAVRQLVQQRIARGRVECGVTVQFRQPPVVDVEFNEPLALALTKALDVALQRGMVTGSLTPGDLLRVPQALAIRERPPERDAAIMRQVGSLVTTAVDAALVQLDGMRVTEGAHLGTDLDQRRAVVANMVEQIGKAAMDGQADVQARLAARVQELTADIQVDRAAVALEVVRFAARSDISEELSRFRAHVVHWQQLATADEPCGRKLDFLLQEMNREVNTMGSKADGLNVSEIIIAVKAELEKMKEQVQNVE